MYVFSYMLTSGVKPMSVWDVLHLQDINLQGFKIIGQVLRSRIWQQIEWTWTSF
jgi:hypothetical protein